MTTKLLVLDKGIETNRGIETDKRAGSAHLPPPSLKWHRRCLMAAATMRHVRISLFGPFLEVGLMLGNPGIGDIIDGFLVEIDFAHHRVQLGGIDGVIHRNLMGDRPFILHAGPTIFPDLAM